MEDLNSRLDAKLVKAARIKAGRLAQLSGRKLGNILLLTEATEPVTNPLQFLLEMIRLDGSEGKRNTMNLFQDKVRLEKTVKVRFAW
jgi:hypothetical protein